MPAPWTHPTFNAPTGPAAGGSTTALPNSTTQQTTANLANGATLNFDFLSADQEPIFDIFVFADQLVDVAVFVRQGATDTYRQWGNLYKMPAASAVWVPFTGLRIPGSHVRIQLQNNSGNATTVVSAQVRASSL